MEKKKYISAKLEVVEIKTEDVLFISNLLNIVTPWDEFDVNAEDNLNW